jgi:hypothetical protein
MLATAAVSEDDDVNSASALRVQHWPAIVKIRKWLSLWCLFTSEEVVERTSASRHVIYINEYSIERLDTNKGSVAIFLFSSEPSDLWGRAKRDYFIIRE